MDTEIGKIEIGTRIYLSFDEQGNAIELLDTSAAPEEARHWVSSKRLVVVAVVTEFLNV